MNRSSFTLLLLLAFTCLASAEKKVSLMKARTVYHANGTYTKSTMDAISREQTEFTFEHHGTAADDQHDVLISKKVYLLNDKGQTIQGNVYDGRGALKARAQFLFDDFGRMMEQRMTNLQGEVYQRIMFTYDSKGNELPPKSYTYHTQAPDMKAAVIDFTDVPPPPGALDRSESGAGMQGNVPRLPESSASGQGGGMDPIRVDMNSGSGEPAKKPSIWKRMFSKDKKDEKK